MVKIYRVKFTLSNGETIIHHGRRKTMVKEWEQLLQLPVDKILRKLKMHKDKSIKLLQINLIDWSGNVTLKKTFEEETL